MGGFGHGVRMMRRRQVLQGLGALLVTSILPGNAWAGTAASGFSSPPVDPVRVTAKPVMRLLVPPNQFFTSSLLLGVYAGANHNGSLLDNMGLEKVVVHYEGSTSEIKEPSWQVLTDANGKRVSYFGWWTRLRHNGVNGHAHVYFEAIPKDPTMQRRVIGPYQFSPQPVIHDKELVVAPSLPQVTGSRYPSIQTALAYIKTQAFGNPRITVTEPGFYSLVGASPSHACQGYVTIEASVPVTIGRPAYTTDTAAAARTRLDGLRFKGANITLDFQNMSEIYNEGLRDHWLDGVVMTNTAGRATLWRKGGRPVSWTVRGAPWFTECDMSQTNDMAKFANLVRGCYIHHGYGDCLSTSRCVIGNTVEDWDASSFTSEIPSLRVQYTGAGTSATLSGTKSGSARTFTAKVNGTSVGTFTVNNTEAFYTAGTNYDVADVVAWLNSLPGWTATLLDDTRNASLLVTSGLKSSSSFGDTDARTAPLTLITMLDIHADWYQANFAGYTYENIVVADNTTFGMIGQNLYLGNGSQPIKDMLIINNAWHNGENWATYKSQLLGSESHVVVAHNSFATQDLTFRTDGSYVADGYSLVADNALSALYFTGNADPILKLQDNHIMDGQSPPPGAVGTSIGGTAASNFGNAANGDFTPAGHLLVNMKSPSVRYDRKAKKRGVTAPVGMLS